jgi:quercetin dioxygenase-like cupin family protein
MRYIRVYNDDDGTARFSDGEVAFERADFAPPAPPLDVSSAAPAREMLFVRFPAGWTDPAHPSPARQWMFVLSGRGESTAGGETRPWGPGDAFLLEDTAPPGHGTTILEDAVLAVVRC